VQVYAPTNSAEAADIEDFYNDLQAALNETPKRDVLIIMGNWNAKIGKGEEPATVGRHGLGNRNEAGERLLEFCEENALFLANTYFELPERRLYADGKHKNQTDYVLDRRRWRSPLQSVKTKRNADCGSDTNSSQPQ
jgi:hypothetical protein